MNTERTFAEDQMTVAEMVVAYPAALSVFRKYNIDYCCGGHRPLDESCTRVGLDAEKIRKEIESSTSTGTKQSLRFDQWSSGLLVDYIIANHHEYVKNAIPEIQFFLDKVCAAHGDDSPHLLTIRTDFEALAEELTSHMHKEEFVLFPAIKKLEAKDYVNMPLSITIQSPLKAMEDEHETAGDLTKSIRSLSNNYTVPAYACPTYKITYQKLQEFDNDLMMHIHLENNILFKRVRENTKAE